MRVSPLFVGLLGTGVTAFHFDAIPVHGANKHIKREKECTVKHINALSAQANLNDTFKGILVCDDEESPEPTTTIIKATSLDSPTAVDKTQENEIAPTASSRPEKCTYEFFDRDPAKKAWEETEPEKFLLGYLDEHGVEDWSKDFLVDTVRGNKPLGHTFSCSYIQDTSSCSLPGERACETYDPYEAYYIHQSIGNLNRMFHILYATLVNDELDDLISKASDMEGMYGDGKPDNIFSALVGGFSMGVTMATPVLGMGMLSILNLSNNMAYKDENSEDTVQKTIQSTYSGLREHISLIARGAFDGGSDGLDDFDAKDFLKNAFSDGEMLATIDVEDTIEIHRKSIEAMVNAVVLMACLNSNEWLVRISDYKEDKCKDETDGTGYWLDTPHHGKRCVAFARVTIGTSSGIGRLQSDYKVEHFSNDQWEAFKKFRVDVEGSLKNILACDGGEPDFADASKIDFEPPYPPCMFPNMEFETQTV